MIIYTLIGIVWTLFFDWLLRNFSPDGNGLPTIKSHIIHTFAWPLAILITIYKVTDKNNDE